MRIVGLVLAAGCGRLDFGARPDAAVDAKPPMTVCMTNSLATGVDLCTVDVTTGQVQVLGTLPTSVGDLGGLGWWGSNELYAGNRTGDIVDIALSPLSGAIVANVGGHVGGLDRVDGKLLAIDQASMEIVSFQPPSLAFARTPLTSSGAPLVSSGGDLVEMSTGDVLLWPNVNGQLFRLDVTTGVATPLGPVVSGTPSISGLVRDDADRLYGVTAANSQLIDIDPSTGALGASRTLCVSCPTPYTFVSGDLTRSP